MRRQEEHNAQVALFQWAAIERRKWPELALLFAVPNGSNKSMAQAVKFKREGLKAGVPDVWLPVPRGKFNGLIIEMKKEKGGTLSQEQRWWIDRLSERGYWVEVCRGLDAAIKTIEGYLGQ